MNQTPVTFLGPLSLAFERMKQMLFRPFDIGKWFALGFTAWLAYLDQGGNSFNFRSGHHARHGEWSGMIHEYWWIIVPVLVFVVILLIAIGLLLMWINARGKFMFLDNVVKNRSLVAAPWKEYRREGNSLFLWSLGFMLASLAIFIAPLLVLVIAAAMFHNGVMSSWMVTVPLLFVGITGLLIWILLVSYASLFLGDFIIPLMYRYRLPASEIWRKFLVLFRWNQGRFLAYGFFRLFMFIAYGMFIVTIGFGTCCCGFVIMLIPYLGAVFLLPLPVIDRSYSIEFLRQFGLDFDVFVAEPPPLA